MTIQDASLQPDDREADDLNALLDALATGQRSPTTDLDPAIAASARQIHDLSGAHVAPRLTHLESERLWEDLMQTHTGSPALPFRGPISRSPAAGAAGAITARVRHREARLLLVGSAASAPTASRSPMLGSRGASLRRRWTRHGWPIVELVGAAALIIGLVSVIMSGLGGDNGGRPAFVPMAGVGTATPSAESEDLAAIPDPGQTGVMPGPGIDGQPELVWRVPIETGSDSLAVADETIVRAHASQQSNQTSSWVIETLSARAGTPNWESQVGASDVQISGMWQGTIVLTANALDSPVSVRGEPLGETNQGLVIGLDLTTGDVQWSTQITEDSTLPTTILWPTIADDTVLVPTSAGKLYSLALPGGSVNWIVEVADEDVPLAANLTLSRPAVADGLVTMYSGQTGSAYAFDAVTGRRNWESEITGDPVAGLSPTTVSGPVMTGGSVFFTTADYGYGDDAGGAQSLISINAQSGNMDWTTELEPIDLTTGARPYGVGQPYVAGDNIIVSIAGANGFGLTAFSAETGDQVWDHSFGDALFSQLSIAGDTAYAARVEGELTGIDVQTGDELWSLATGGELRSAPYIVDGMVYQVGQDGQLYALGSGTTADAALDPSTDISGLPSCDVEPRPDPTLTQDGGPFTPPDPTELGTPAATLVDPVYVSSQGNQFPTAPTIAWDNLPVGSPADANIADEIAVTVDGITTCARAGNDGQVATFFSEDFFLRPYISQATYSSGYLTFSSSYLPVMSNDLRILDDGRVGMIATEGQMSGEIGNNQATLYIFAERPDGQWLIDEVVIVNNSGEAPQG